MKSTVQMAAAAMAVASLGGSALAAGERAELSMPFKASTPSTETGLNLDLRYLNPNGRDAKPPAITKLALHLPAGTRLDPTALPVCAASDLEIQLRGRDACPRESLVGTGKLDVYLGAPGDPRATDLALFNGPGQIIEILLFEGTNTTAAFERLFIEGATIRANPVQVPPVGPPELRFAASRIVWDVPPKGRYIVTPPTCPPDGQWRTTGEFEFADGGSTTVASTQGCVSNVNREVRELLRIVVKPRSIVRGRSTRLRIRLLAGDRACLRGATVRLGGRSARTDRRGRATLVVRVRRRRLAKLHARTRGCGSVRMMLRVRRR